MYNERIFLCEEIETEKKDEYGDNITEVKKRPVFAKKKSIGTKEFYQAQTEGEKPEIKLEIADYLDYKGEQIVQYHDHAYKVLRTFQPENSSKLEITCYGGVRNVNTEIGN